MSTTMKLLQEVVTCLTVLTIFCACVMAFPSSSFNTGTRNGELETLLEELRKELSINAKPNSMRNELSLPNSRFSVSQVKDNPHFGTLENYPTSEVRAHPLLSVLLSKNGNSNTFDVNKRQGSWDYDYGLGGGRFGKRAFGDYSLGGGRFGRDVSRAQGMEAEEMLDFEDPISD
ncbi:uncharacterized protein LOC123538455 [Mercenaria mercenaria]|uniref:uncharacterized protein LOC123538455 n=1 Tax=Mercenaria mercenaria TaxID=6596 RepID=UPI001E1D4B20|nr:uncharacterized protein LOC123538455 [Mercenaria mercenaria]XP_045178505.1 uncharacterized protein LOC123538455 [Mercenaria mercenaria]XP_045178506.1 uncharacterized protein LOC123538455 [Mercenaria mercenaria]XP_045178507.1 uncharacterized protein LOC123538455 [Mercenaria mercenaria]